MYSSTDRSLHGSIVTALSLLLPLLLLRACDAFTIPFARTTNNPRRPPTFLGTSSSSSSSLSSPGDSSSSSTTTIVKSIHIHSLTILHTALFLLLLHLF
mmetsp:Transcript_31216/g.38125  ORF Transcript_31216/g.38125 Transcript_31216/m.38125 type:complete len:99 (-) Transcript_31216:5301-5597(-)